MKYTYESGFAPYILGLIQQKQSDGFNYDNDMYHLKKFDEFCVSRFPAATVVTGNIAAAWAVIRPTEGKTYRNRRVVVLRQLCLYMLSLGLETYVPRNIGRGEKPVLYIPSPKELAEFFKELDAWTCRERIGKRTVIEYKILFRLYYCCGLRLSEARLLKKENVDFDKGVLTILASKGRKSRLVYLPADGTAMLSDYLTQIEKELPGSPWLFPGEFAADPLTGSAIQRRFKDCWNRLPSAAHMDKCPTPHCLRHAFVVERMNDWMRSGVDLQEVLPYLSSYLGHKSPSETFYYYHLVNKAFAVIKQKDTVSDRVIPEVLPYEDI